MSSSRPLARSRIFPQPLSFVQKNVTQRVMGSLQDSAAERNRERGIALHAAGDFAGALAAYDMALRSDPMDGAIHFHRGNSLVMLQRIEDGIVSYDRCLALEPAYLEARYNRARALVQ